LVLFLVLFSEKTFPNFIFILDKNMGLFNISLAPLLLLKIKVTLVK